MLYVNGELLQVRPGQSLFDALIDDDNWCEKDIVDEDGKCIRCGQEMCVCKQMEEVTEGV